MEERRCQNTRCQIVLTPNQMGLCHDCLVDIKQLEQKKLKFKAPTYSFSYHEQKPQSSYYEME